jgi:anti-sigma regulatory factor (Ser/Thr protein kinase)
MDPFLIERWVGHLDRLTVYDEASVSEARQRARAAAAEAGMSAESAATLALVASELAHNQLRHARGGVIAVRVFARGDRLGVEIVAADRGGGIADPTAAIERGASPAAMGGSLGAGLSAVLRLADEVDFDIRRGQGTCVWARKLEGATRRREVAVLGRPADGERISGDDAIFARDDDTLVVALADGLGHGPEASLAARAAVEIVRGAPGRALPDLLREASAALVRTRGAAMSIVRIDERFAELRHAGVGNVTAHVVSGDTQRAFSGVSAVLGMEPARAPMRRSRTDEEHAPFGPWDVAFAFTDGLATRTRLEPAPGALRRHPVLIADALLKAFGRSHDDATVVVVG